MHILLWIIGIIIWLVLGLYTMRKWTGSMISMVGYNYPWFAIALMIGCIVLWPVQHVWCALLATTVGRYIDSKR